MHRGKPDTKPKLIVLNSHSPSSSLRLFHPYFLIACAGLLAFAPVSFMIRSLKNDVVALEYPINHFMSQCIHNGEIPYWFNTWAMGFPLQSNLTWGIYSTPQMLFCSFFNYDIFSLHIEFMFFVLLSGLGMFYLLKKYFLKDETIAVMLSCCYMLSGFMVGSGQWMLYITAAAFIPIVLSSLLRLLRQPSFKHALSFAILYFIMFTSVYAALNIITTYCLFIFVVIYLLNTKSGGRRKIVLSKYILLAASMTILLCLPCFLSTLELLRNIGRGAPISGKERFFNSNYLHPYGLSTLLLPFSSVKMRFPNTEGTMLNTYAGLFVLLTLPAAISQMIKEKKRSALIVLFTAIFFLLISFGSLLPIRNALNILPGFSYFRNPSIFRFYFILFLVIYLGIVFQNLSCQNIFNLRDGPYARTLKFCFLFLILLYLLISLMHFTAAKSFSFTPVFNSIKNITYSQSIFISALVQLIFTCLIFYSVLQKHYRLAKMFFISDLVVNTLICTPYFVVSSYSLPQVNATLHSEKGFPVQHEKVNQAMAIYTDEKLNNWPNVNIFNKKVSANKSYRGPLLLKNFAAYADDSLVSKQAFNYPLVFLDRDSLSKKNAARLIMQRPTHIRVEVDIKESTTVTAMQNYFPGWKTYYNNKLTGFINQDKPGLTIVIPAGKGTIDFVYKKSGIWISALLLHLITLSFLSVCVYEKIRTTAKSFSPSLPSR